MRMEGCRRHRGCAERRIRYRFLRYAGHLVERLQQLPHLAPASLTTGSPSDNGLPATVRHGRGLPAGSGSSGSDFDGGVGYLLKDRVSDLSSFGADLRKVALGETVIDPELVARLVARRRQRDPLDRLTD